MNKKNLIIIDADSIAYIGSATDTIQQIFEKVDYKIEEILKETNADYYLIALSQGKYFRHELTSKESDITYKGTRKYDTQPWKQVIKEYLTVKYDGFALKGVEADDILSWLRSKTLCYGKFTYSAGDFVYDIFNNDSLLTEVEEVNIIISSIDKDILYGVPGKHLNYNKKLPDGSWGMQWVETSVEEANYSLWQQMLEGDTSDNVITIKGVGPKTAQKILNKGLEGGHKLREIVLSKYVDDWFGLDEGIQRFRLNYLLLKMIDSDDMFFDRVGYIPDINEILFQKVNKLEEVKPVKIDF